MKEQQVTLLGIGTYPSLHHAACITHLLNFKSCKLLNSNNRFSLKINDVELQNRSAESTVLEDAGCEVLLSNSHGNDNTACFKMPVNDTVVILWEQFLHVLSMLKC